MQDHGNAQVLNFPVARDYFNRHPFREGLVENWQGLL